MKLETSRLGLFEITRENILEIHALNSFPEVSQFNTVGIPDHPKQTEALLSPVLDEIGKSDRRNFGWIIRDKDTDEFIGEVGMSLGLARYAKGEVHYNLDPLFWGKGFATEAVKEVLRFGFEDLKLHRIEAGVAIQNVASIRVLEKVGMKREGHHRKILPLKTGWTDNYSYAILDDDPRP